MIVLFRKERIPRLAIRVIPGLIIMAFIAACRSASAQAVSDGRGFVAAPEKEALSVSVPYRGFNLLGRFSKDWSNAGFMEDDFRLIHELGFNFARLPVDYRTYVDERDWLRLKETELRDIDQAIAWGQRYGVHVNLNLHRAPGFCINPPAEPESLWTDSEAQSAFIAHWVFFAKRYARIAPEHLSFNLVNEPYGIDAPGYAAIAVRAINAIRAVDPDRPVHSDGIEGGRVPVRELLGSGVTQSFHDYAPFSVTHYKAEWVGGSDPWPEPVWPVAPVSQFLYGPGKREIQTPLVVRGNFKAGSKIVIRVGQVSARSRIIAAMDGQTAFDKLFMPGPGSGEWKKVNYSEEWKIYQNVYDLDCEFKVAHDAKELRVENTEGDWCTFSRLSIIAPGPRGKRQDLIPGLGDWGLPQATFKLDSEGLRLEKAPPGFEAQYSGTFGPWKEYMDAGGKAFVGEMGVYKFTSHDLSLRWLEDQLKEIKALGLGWALWNFSGPFGPLDSERADVAYEEYQGRKLDRKMLEILKRY